MKKERRQNTRISASFEIRILASRKVIPLKTWNLSMRGMECPTAPQFREGGTCQIKFKLSPEIRFTVKGKFVRVQQQETGIFFTAIDEEGFYHLKRIVQYNSPDPDKIDRELASSFHPNKKLQSGK